MESIAAARAGEGWTLRTGISPGADQAFYRGARAAQGRVELFLPWPGFEQGAWREGRNGVTVHERPSTRAYALAERFHPRWERLGARERDLLARDGHEVLGGDLATPVLFVACWTACGSLDGEGLLAEGTGQALRIAHHRGIPVYNLARREHARRLSPAP